MEAGPRFPSSLLLPCGSKGGGNPVSKGSFQVLTITALNNFTNCYAKLVGKTTPFQRLMDCQQVLPVFQIVSWVFIKV